NRSEHGNHGVVQGPDDAIYMVHGNYTKIPDGIELDPHGNWAEDVLLPRLWDPRGHAVNIMAPGGQVLRYDGSMHLYAAGMRNTYDITFHDGDLFGYDADMEWDIGTPWYRAPRLIHIIPGAEYGWRAGTAKWSPSFPDSLPPVLDTDVGSPTGMVSVRGSGFPDEYQDAVLMADWSYGRIFAVHLTPSGATFEGRNETFLTGRPFNVTDL
ncbi:MAG: heme-binding protein, partial [Planctomycetales bacterium]|nr:heme-binding protein [Planctomycetales bacterium]